MDLLDLDILDLQPVSCFLDEHNGSAEDDGHGAQAAAAAHTHNHNRPSPVVFIIVAMSSMLLLLLLLAAFTCPAHGVDAQQVGVNVAESVTDCLDKAKALCDHCHFTKSCWASCAQDHESELRAAGCVTAVPFRGSSRSSVTGVRNTTAGAAAASLSGPDEPQSASFPPLGWQVVTKPCSVRDVSLLPQ